MDSKNNFVVDENVFQCSICLDLWLGRDGRVLSCQHTFCLECVEKVVEGGYIKCPTCRQITTMPKKGVKDIPKNLFSQSVEKLENISKKCSEHNKIIIQPQLVCLTCEANNLCQECFDNIHSSLNCNVKTLQFLEKSTNELKTKCKSRIDEQNEKDKTDKRHILQMVSKQKKIVFDCLNKKFSDIKQKIEDFYDKRSKSLDDAWSNTDNIFLDSDKIDRLLHECKNTGLMLNKNPKLTIDFDVLLYSDPRNRIPKINGQKVNDQSPCKSAKFIENKNCLEDAISEN